MYGNIKMKKICFFFLFFALSGCGLPDATDLEDLNPPQSVQVSKVCSGSTLTGVNVSFYGFNNEDFFSGYNIYLITSPSETDMASVVSRHIISGDIKKFDTYIENNNILRNPVNGYPSIRKTDIGTTTYATRPTLITKFFANTPLGMNNGNFQNGSAYYFAVTAVSLSKVQETLSTNLYPSISDSNPALSCP